MNKLIVIAILFCNTTQAGLFKISDRTYGNVPAPLQTVVDQIFNNLETQVNDKVLPMADTSTYLTGIANSAAMTNVGNGIDYSSRMGLFLIGATGAAGADLGGGSLSNFEPKKFAGFAGQGTLTLGFRPGYFSKAKWGWFDLERARFYLDYFNQSFNYSETSFKTSALGLFIQYKIVPEKSVGYGSLKWGGVDITTGYRSSTTSFKSTTQVSEQATNTINFPPPTSLTAQFDGTINLGAEYNINTLPIEISTATTLFYIFSLYGGLGMDINSGNSKSIADLSGPVTMTSPSNLINGVGATASLDLGDSGKPKSVYGRYFLGTQIQLGIVSVFLQYSSFVDKSAVGGSAGLRLYW